MSSTEADGMATLAEEAGVKVFCDFTYHFSPVINFLVTDPSASLVVKEMREYTSYRTSLGIVQSSVDVLADLTVHVGWNSPKKVRLISIASKDCGVLLEEMNREAPILLVHFS